MLAAALVVLCACVATTPFANEPVRLDAWTDATANSSQEIIALADSASDVKVEVEREQAMAGDGARHD